MAFPTTCGVPALNAIPGALHGLSDKELQALLVYYLYRQKNPSTSGTVAADSLLSTAKCLDCGPSDHMLLALEVWIQRQAAIDAGYSAGTFSASTAISNAYSLVNLAPHQLRAIELYLRCQLS